MQEFNNTQKEIIKLFKQERSEEELFEIRKMLLDYLFDKAINLADKVYDEKGYTAEVVEKWKEEHYSRH